MLVSSRITVFVHGRIKSTGNSSAATALGRANSPEAPLRIEATRRKVGIAETNEGNRKQLRSSRVQQIDGARGDAEQNEVGQEKLKRSCSYHGPQWDLPWMRTMFLTASRAARLHSHMVWRGHAWEQTPEQTDMDFPEVLRSARVCFIYGTNQR